LVRKKLSSLSSFAEIATTLIVGPNFPSSSTKRLRKNKQDVIPASDDIVVVNVIKQKNASGFIWW
jgi:hypothetical protein